MSHAKFCQAEAFDAQVLRQTSVRRSGARGVPLSVLKTAVQVSSPVPESLRGASRTETERTYHHCSTSPRRHGSLARLQPSSARAEVFASKGAARTTKKYKACRCSRSFLQGGPCCSIWSVCEGTDQRSRGLDFNFNCTGICLLSLEHTSWLETMTAVTAGFSRLLPAQRT